MQDKQIASEKAMQHTALISEHNAEMRPISLNCWQEAIGAIPWWSQESNLWRIFSLMWNKNSYTQKLHLRPELQVIRCMLKFDIQHEVSL